MFFRTVTLIGPDGNEWAYPDGQPIPRIGEAVNIYTRDPSTLQFRGVVLDVLTNLILDSDVMIVVTLGDRDNPAEGFTPGEAKGARR